MFEVVAVIPCAPGCGHKHIPVNVRGFLSLLPIDIYEVSLGVLPAGKGDT